jgi:hypothetical protein
MPRQPTAPVPSDVAGFHFGMAPDEFAATCKRVGKVGTPFDDQDLGTRIRVCDDVQLDGLKTTLLVATCEHDTRVCELTSVVLNGAIAAFHRADAALVARLGEPIDDTNRTVSNDAVDAECTRGPAKIRRTWWWGRPGAITGRLLLSLECKPGEATLVLFRDDEVGAAAQIRLAKLRGVVPVRGW